MSLLTICIPTYKRLSLLSTLLDGLLPQAQALGVKILLNDNCSQDGTAEYLADLSAKYSCLSFRVNATSIPIDENMFLVMQLAESQYVYPLGDDDFLPDGALIAIINALTHQPDLLVLFGLFADAKLNPKKNLLPEELHGKVFDDPRPAFASLWNKMPFGSFVVRHDFITLPAFKKYFGTCHAYTGGVWEKLGEKFTDSKKVTISCMRSSTVILRGGEKSWKDYKARIYLYEIPRWLDLLPSIYSSDIINIRDEHIRKYGTLVAMLAFRRSGQLKLDNHQLYMTYFSETEQKKALIVSYFPPFVAAILRFLLKICIRIKLLPNS